MQLFYRINNNISMKRKFVTILTALFAAAAIGLVIVQIVQTTKSAALSDNLFNVSVSNAMDDVIEQLNRLKVEDYISQNDRYKLLKYKRIEDITKRMTTLVKENEVLFTNEDMVVTGKLYQDSIYILPNAEFTASDSEAVEKYNHLLANRNKLTNGSAFYDQFVNELSEYLVDNLMSTSTFNYRMLDSLIAEQLVDNGIDIRPQVGILHATKDQFLYISDEGDAEKLKESPYRYNFCPSGIMSPNEYFIILQFPISAIFLQKNINIFFFMSTILILIIFLLFLLSIRTIKNQRELDEMKTDFINNMTHEIKTPISTISLACEILQDKTISESEGTRKQYLGIIDNENKKMRLLIDRMLQSAKMSNRKYSIKPKETDIHEMIQQILNSFGLSIQSKKGIVETYLKATPSTLMVDELLFNGLINNLVDNAIKYSPNKLHITIETANEGDCFKLKVSDEGNGISEDDQKHIFEKFYRVPNGNIHNVKGFGIGLNYVQQVVALHGGKIKVISEPNKGTTFEILIPRI